MPATRCLFHGNFPASYAYSDCPICGERTTYDANIQPDEDWESKILRKQEHAVEQESEDLHVLVIEGVAVFLEGDNYYLSSHEIIRAGVQRRLRDGDLLQIGKQVFEVQDYSYSTRRYLVRPFSTTLSDEDLASLTGP